ncbi:MAG TPA: hypothetical protein VEA69_09150 [Tepidisphaeraceae bacterium]|nr:hypothetical protein [Tepidisphaeraceae bacterium]
MPAPLLDYRSPLTTLQRRRPYPLWLGVVVALWTPTLCILLPLALDRAGGRGMSLGLTAFCTYGIIAAVAWANFALLARHTNPRLVGAGPLFLCTLAMLVSALTAIGATIITIIAPYIRYAD